MKHTTKRRRGRPRDPYVRPLRELEGRAEAMMHGDFSTLGQQLGGPPAVESMRRALDVMAAHVEQAQRGMHSYIGALTTAQEAERGRIARELHDDTVQRLVALGQGVDRVQRALDRSDPTLARERLGGLRGEITGVVQALRAVVADLRPPALDELGLLPAVELLVQRTGEGPEVEVLVEGEARRLDAQSELGLFRIIQEAWSNIRRHAQAQHVRIRFEYTRNALIMTIEDDGRGFVPPEQGQTVAGKWGLLGMRERAALAGATLTLASRPGLGTQLEVRMPYLGIEGRDPVCGMEVGPDALSVEYGDRLYRFCSQACHDSFVAQPARYVQATGG